MDIVYLVKNDEENDSEELKYSLRSLKNLPHNLVHIVGEKPEWATNINYIPVKQSKTKYENWLMNLVAAINNKSISDDFVMMNDDFFIMKQIYTIPNIHFGDMKRRIEAYDLRYPEGSDYIDNMKKCYILLKKLGYNKPISYELHTPMILNKQNVIQMLEDLANWPDGNLRTLYGNYFNVGGIQAEDVKVFLEPRHNHIEYNQNPELYLEKQVLLSATGLSFKTGIVGRFIRKSLKEKSEYEV